MDSLSSKDTKRGKSNGKGFATAAVVFAIIGIVMAFIPLISIGAYVPAAFAVLFGLIGVVKKAGPTAIVALILGGVAVAISINYQQSLSNSLNKVSDDLKKTSDDISGKNTDQLLGKEVSVDLGQFSATAGAYGVTTTELPVTVKNLNSESKSYTIKIEAVDGDGKRIDDDTVYASSLGSNQSQDFKAFTLVTSDKVEALKSAAFKIASVSTI